MTPLKLVTDTPLRQLGLTLTLTLTVILNTNPDINHTNPTPKPPFLNEIKRSWHSI